MLITISIWIANRIFVVADAVKAVATWFFWLGRAEEKKRVEDKMLDLIADMLREPAPPTAAPKPVAKLTGYRQ